MRQMTLSHAFTRYLLTTTFHGFKYLTARNKWDRIVWMVGCYVSACSSGVLCAVLWTRFVQLPTLLALRHAHVTDLMPSVGVCFTADFVAQSVVRGIHYNDTLPLAKALTSVLRGKPAPEYQLYDLENLLRVQELSLQGALFKFTPSCVELFSKCRVDGQFVPCKTIIHRDLTPYGACCIMRSSRSLREQQAFYDNIKTIEIVLNSSMEQAFPIFDFITYGDLGWVRSSSLLAGYSYSSPVRFQAIVGNSAEELAGGACVNRDGYSLTLCREQCAEKHCTCSDPLRVFDDEKEINLFHLCPLAQITCLRSYNPTETSECGCLPSCNQVKSFMTLKQHLLDANQYTWDPFFENVTRKSSIVLKIYVEMIGSHVFERMPTQSWLTLLSSLGGVFNMFLGVGLFSALELAFFICVRLPIAMRRSREGTTDNTTRPTQLGAWQTWRRWN